MLKYFSIAILFYIFASYLVNNKHGGLYIAHDSEGYYLYLPAIFIYGTFKNIPYRTPEYFPKDPTTGKIHDKYTCGTAILVSPFFGAAHFWRWAKGIKQQDPYAEEYSIAMLFAACVYASIGIYFLYNFLIQFFQKKIASFTIISLTLGTNVLHYITREPLLSHIYSFCLVAIFLYLTSKFYTYKIPNTKLYFLLGIVLGFITLMRPTNIIFLLFFVGWNVRTWKDLKENLRRLFDKKIVFTALGGLLVWLPQMAYWYYLSGKFIFYSYGNESFIYWKNPKIWKVWFDVLNGLFPYSPLIAFCIIGILLGLYRKKENMLSLATIFLGSSYLFGSWWCWWFGGAHGQRSFVDMMPLLSLPFAYFLQHIFMLKNSFIKYGIFSIILILIFINIRMVILHNYGWYGDDWNWNAYFSLVKKCLFL